MLQVTIKDTKTNEVIYDEQVSMIFMQAPEKNGIRSIMAYTRRRAPLRTIAVCRCDKEGNRRIK